MGGSGVWDVFIVAAIAAAALLDLALVIAAASSCMGRRFRDPSAQGAWMLVILSVPVIGPILYLLGGPVAPRAPREKTRGAP